MNKTLLNRPFLYKSKYVVYFDEDNRFTFTDKRQACDFIMRVAREIDQAIMLISEELTVLDQFYRLYCLADKDYKFKFTIDQSIDYLNNRLTYIYTHHGSENYNVILYQSIVGCIKELHESFSLLHDKAGKRRDTITKRRCSLKMHITDLYLNNFLAIGIKQTVVKFKIKKAK
jgi:hypothetical protein